MPNIRDAEQIRAIIDARGITRLFHFTRLSNLESILERGLLTRTQLTEQTLYHANNGNRRDKHPNATCCTIEFPNYKMFCVVRGNGGTADWVIIELTADILLQKKCAFYTTNAASDIIINRYPDDFNGSEAFIDFQGVTAFQNMFAEVGGDTWTRVQMRQPDNYTTNPQAEVLVFDQIEQNYISAIYTDDKNIADAWNAREPNINLTIRYDLFQGRHDWKSWRGRG